VRRARKTAPRAMQQVIRPRDYAAGDSPWLCNRDGYQRERVRGAYSLTTQADSDSDGGSEGPATGPRVRFGGSSRPGRAGPAGGRAGASDSARGGGDPDALSEPPPLSSGRRPCRGAARAAGPGWPGLRGIRPRASESSRGSDASDPSHGGGSIGTPDWTHRARAAGAPARPPPRGPSAGIRPGGSGLRAGPGRGAARARDERLAGQRGDRRPAPPSRARRAPSPPPTHGFTGLASLTHSLEYAATAPARRPRIRSAARFWVNLILLPAPCAWG
jgi:hypothetical protein